MAGWAASWAASSRRRGPLRRDGRRREWAAHHDAGTHEVGRNRRIAKVSGGDSLRVDEVSALETTLMRLRQRDALRFNPPEGVQPGQERNIQVELSDAARRR